MKQEKNNSRESVPLKETLLGFGHSDISSYLMCVASSIDNCASHTFSVCGFLHFCASLTFLEEDTTWCLNSALIYNTFNMLCYPFKATLNVFPSNRLIYLAVDL